MNTYGAYKKFLSPIEVIFSLIKNLTKNMEYLRDGEFPSPIGVIFSLIMVEPFGVMDPKLVARFPSPIGVIFSLIGVMKMWKCKKCGWFPSPIRVIFSLIFIFSVYEKRFFIQVSVSYRSYILTYYIKNVCLYNGGTFEFPSPIGVIFSLI